MTLTRVAPPVGPPVSDADLAEHARLAHAVGADGAPAPSADLAALQRARDAAVAVVERACGLALLRQTWDWTLLWRDRARPAPLPIAPASAVLSVAELADDGTLTPLDPSAYALDRAAPRAALRLLSPAAPLRPGRGGLTVRFEAGFGVAPDEVPADLRQAVLMLAAHYFERRHAADDPALAPPPFAVAAILEPWRPIRL